MSYYALPPELSRRADQGALAHAWIVYGDSPAQLEELGKALAAAFLCGGEGRRPCGECKHCRKVEKGIHPDLQWVGRAEGKTQISVEQVRQLRSDAYIRPNEAGRKVYILQEAQLMTDEAQNAFLKVLEEGPAYSVFLLLTPNPRALLPTVRSRCELLRCVQAGAETDEEAARKGGELAGLLLGEDRWRLLCWCAPYDKAKREEVLPIWDHARQALLTYRRGETSAKAVRLTQTLGRMIDAGGRNGNIGALWGLLWAAT